MKRRRVRYLETASDDIEKLFDQLSTAAGPVIAMRYIDRMKAYCDRLDLASERGQRRDDLMPGLRAIGFERRATIAFYVEPDQVLIARILYGGRDWEAELSDE